MLKVLIFWANIFMRFYGDQETVRVHVHVHVHVHANPKTSENLLAQGVFARKDPPGIIKQNLKEETASWANVSGCSTQRKCGVDSG